jgi:hypothetical protein
MGRHRNAINADGKTKSNSRFPSHRADRSPAITVHSRATRLSPITVNGYEWPYPWGCPYHTEKIDLIVQAVGAFGAGHVKSLTLGQVGRETGGMRRCGSKPVRWEPSTPVLLSDRRGVSWTPAPPGALRWCSPEDCSHSRRANDLRSRGLYIIRPCRDRGTLFPDYAEGS